MSRAVHRTCYLVAAAVLIICVILMQVFDMETPEDQTGVLVVEPPPLPQYQVQEEEEDKHIQPPPTTQSPHLTIRPPITLSPTSPTSTNAPTSTKYPTSKSPTKFPTSKSPTNLPTTTSPTSTSPTSTTNSPSTNITNITTQSPTLPCIDFHHTPDMLTLPPHWHLFHAKFGQLCNTLQQIVSFQELFLAMSSPNIVLPYEHNLDRNRLPAGITLNPFFTGWALKANLTIMSRNNFSVYTGCEWADRNSAEVNGHVGQCPFMKCTRHYYNGEMFHHPSGALVYVPVVRTPQQMWLLYRPAIFGYSNILSKQRPRLDLMMVAEIAVARLREIQKRIGATAIVGLHRRGLDGRCYRWLQRGAELHGTLLSCVPGAFCASIYECAPNSPKVGFRGGILVNHTHTTASFKKGGKCNNVSNWGDDTTMSAQDETCYTDVSPYYSICDFTFSPFELDYLRRDWPKFAQLGDTSKIMVFLASDGQRPGGDKRLREHVFNMWRQENSTTAHVYTLKELVPEAMTKTTVEDNYALMIAEMWALSFVDLHIPNALSSCDTIIAHWRRDIRGEDAQHGKGEMFPAEACWDGYYYDT